MFYLMIFVLENDLKKLKKINNHQRVVDVVTSFIWSLRYKHFKEMDLNSEEWEKIKAELKEYLMKTHFDMILKLINK